MKTLLTLLLLTTLSTFAQETVPEPNPTAGGGIKLSVETLGVMRSINIGDGEQYGVGLDVGLKLSKPVTLHLRGVSYHDPDQWRGAMIDEASVLAEARLFGSDNGRLTLSALAGGDYNVEPEDFGFSAGARVAFNLTKNFAIVGDSRIRAWFNDVQKDIITTAGLRFSF